jgi:hypothetical protein
LSIIPSQLIAVKPVLVKGIRIITSNGVKTELRDSIA